MANYPPGYLEEIERNMQERFRKRRERICKDLEVKHALTLTEVEQHLHLLTTTEQIILRLRFDIRFETITPITQFPGYAEALAKHKAEETFYFANGGSVEALPNYGNFSVHDEWWFSWSDARDPRRVSERQRVKRPDATVLLRINLANQLLQPAAYPQYGRMFMAFDRIEGFIGLTHSRCREIADVAFAKIAHALGR